MAGSMQTEDTATWIRTKRGGWSLIVTFNRHWEAPAVGTGKGKVWRVTVYRKGEYRGEDADVRLTSRVFRDRGGDLRAFAEEITT